MVKNEYKQTEIGIVPIEWSVSDFGSKVKIYRGGSPRPIQDYLTQAQDGINWIKIGDVREGEKYITSTEEKIIPAGVSRSRTVHAGDFILSNSMSFGRPYILNIDGCIHDGWLTIQEYEKTFSKNFLYYLLSSDSVYQQYISMAAGSSVKNLNKEKVSALVVACPDIEEQERIADVLSNIDSLIAALEKQIPKKKAIKQGAMQELLTGKRRLPGFSGKWRTEIIPEVLQKQEGIKIGPFGSQLKKEYLLDDGPYRVYGQENVYAQDFSIGNRYLNRERFRQLQSCEVRPGDFLISTMGTIGKCAIVPNGIHSGIMDSHLIRLRINEQKLMPEYLLHLFSEELGYLKGQTSKLSVGGIMDGLSTKIVNALNVLYPEDLSEQKAIAEFLSTMNAEIQTLEQKLEKYRQVKQGMMQQLLTGKIRLV